MDNSEAFALLKPVCVKITQDIKNENITMLIETVKLINKNCLQDLQEYVLFPLQFILKSPNKNEDLIQNTIEAMTSILTETRISNFDLLKNILISIMFIISHPKQNGEISNISEELKISIVNCIKKLFQNSNDDVLKTFYSQQYMPQLGHLVFVLLKIAENETNKQLRIKSIECLLIISCNENKKIKKITSQEFASFLPGISISLFRIITGSLTQGHVITTTALKAWSDIVALVLGDMNIELEKKDDIKGIVQNTKLPIITKNDEWVEDTTSKLKILIEKITELVTHLDWRVRLALSNWAGTLLIHCSKSLLNCAAPLIEVLIVLMGDERSIISKNSVELLIQSGNKLQKSRPIVDLVQENIHNLITKLPRIFRVSDDAKKLATLQLLIGYIRILVLINDDFDRLLLSHPQLTRLGHALMQLVELDSSNIQLLTEKKSFINNLVEFNAKPTKKIFKHFKDEKIYSSLTLLCRLLGKHGDLNLLIDHYLQLFHNSNTYKCQSVILIKEFILGAAGIDLDIENYDSFESIFTKKYSKKEINKFELVEIINMLLDEYLEPSVWFLCFNSMDSKSNDGTITLQQININVWSIIAILESVAAFSQVLKNDFEPFLIDVLYPVMEKMGNDLAVISYTSVYCANIIASSIGCCSISDLIYKNSDYLLNSLNIKLRHIEHNPEATMVLRVIIANSGPDILGLIEDSIENLLNALDDFHRQTSEPFMQVLNTLMTSFSIWFLVPSRLEKSIEVTQEPTLYDFFIDYHRLKLIANGENVEDNAIDTDLVNENNEIEDEIKKKPKYIEITIETMRRCSHLLARDKFNFTLLVLDTIEKCVLILASFTDDLLPIIHQLWPTFKLKFTNENLIIVKKAIESLNKLSEICGEFIQKRTLDQIWPKIIQFLNDQAKISEGKLTSVYTSTAAYKLQLESLKCLGKLITNLKINGANIDSLLEVCLQYLNKQQPMALQEAAIETVKLSAEIEPDIVWFHLNYINRSLNELKPTDDEFTKINVIEPNIISAFYEDNLISIFKEIS